MEEKKRSDALVASTTKIDQKMIPEPRLGGVGQDLKSLEGLFGLVTRFQRLPRKFLVLKKMFLELKQLSLK